MAKKNINKKKVNGEEDFEGEEEQETAVNSAN